MQKRREHVWETGAALCTERHLFISDRTRVSKCFQELSTRDGAVPGAATQVCARFSAVMKANIDYVFGSHVTDSIRVPPT